MKTLIVSGHPDPESFSHQLALAYYEERAAAAGEDSVRLLSLGEEDFDPVLRYGYRQRMEPSETIERSQEWMAWADHWVIVTPVWWGAFPALLHGWFERVLTPRFAYKYHNGKLSPEPLLKGKSATAIMMSRGPAVYTRSLPTSPVRVLKSRLLGVCGVKLQRTLLLGGRDTALDTPERRADFEAKVRKAAREQR